MFSQNEAYSSGPSLAVADAAVAERAAFLRRTYTHLLGAVLALVAIEFVFFMTGFAESLARTLLGGRFTWLIVLVAFGVVSGVANRWAHSDTSIGTQYLGLAIYTLAEAVILAPLLFIASGFPDVIPAATVATLLIFVALTAFVLLTGANFSFMRGALTIGGLVAMGLIVCSIIFGFSLGIFFCFAMAGFAAGYILYYTSAVLHDYRAEQHVAASLALFSCVVLLFWYVLRIVLYFSSSD